MQSGRALTKLWVLELRNTAAQYNDPLMGWTGNRDTCQQVKLHFHSLDDALHYAQVHNYNVVLSHPHSTKVMPKCYADNFKFSKIL